MINLKDSFNARGRVRIWQINNSGQKALIRDSSNTLVNGFYTAIPKLIAGEVGAMSGQNNRTVGTGTANWVTYMKIGSGTTATRGTDTDLEEALTGITLPISRVFYSTPFPGSVTFNAVVPGGSDSDLYNTTPLTEVGLFSETGVMYARFVYAAIQKSSIFQLNYEWTITFGN